MALVLQRHQATPPDALPELLASLSKLAGDLDSTSMSERILETAQTVFGASSSLCALAVDGAMRVTRFRGLDLGRLVDATRAPEFRAFLSCRELRVEPSTHPVVAQLNLFEHVAVSLPLAVGRTELGCLVLFLPRPPGPAERLMLEAFAGHVSVCLLASRLNRDVEDSEHRQSSIAHSLAYPVVLVDEGGRLVDVNGAAAQAFHLAAGFEKGQPVTGRLGHPVLEEMLSSGRDGAAEVVVGTTEPRVYRATVRRVRGVDGRVTGRILVLDDVTGVREIDALKADFVAVIGHELRTPITVIKGYLKTLIRRGDTLSDERRAQAHGALESNVGRLERLIEDLLFISAIDQRSAPLDLRPTDLAALLRARAGNRVVVHAPSRPVEVEVDEDRVTQVLHHLLDNALKYSEDEVVVELADRGDAVEVSVTDTGPGIFSGDLPHLFERFRQLDGSSTRDHGGVGIGLYICRRVVEAMGGRIWCDSRLGVGSKFVFALPRTAEVARVGERSAGRPEVGAPR